MFQAILIDATDHGTRAHLSRLSANDLPEGDVHVRVDYSTLNYKDALAITGRGPVVRRYPMVPGIDLAGVVTESGHSSLQPGDGVLLTGWGVGEDWYGGLSQNACVRHEWLLPLPGAMEPFHAMALGTAGLAAMLSVMAIERHGVQPDDGDILVTGAVGGVGSLAILLLSRLGYDVIALTGRPDQKPYLQSLGARDIVLRQDFERPGRQPLGRERWAGAIDVVGGQVLSNVCATTRYRGVVAACGLAGGMDSPGSMAPFILRGVTLAGIDSVHCPMPERRHAWHRLSQILDLAQLEKLARCVALGAVFERADALLAGQLQGRVVVGLGPH